MVFKIYTLQTWTYPSATMYSIYLLFIMCFLTTFYHFSVLISWNVFKTTALPSGKWQWWMMTMMNSNWLSPAWTYISPSRTDTNWSQWNAWSQTDDHQYLRGNCASYWCSTVS